MKTPLRRYMNAIMDDDGTRIAVVLGVKNAAALIHASNCHDELVNALEQARAALPDAWAAVKCNVPGDVLSLVDAAIANATPERRPAVVETLVALPPAETIDEVAAQRDHAVRALTKLLLQSGNPNAFCTIAAMEAREIVKAHDPDAYRLITGHSI